MTEFVLATLIIGGAMLIMAVGVLFNYRCLRGSCGGGEVVGLDGESVSCATCPRRRGSGSRDSDPAAGGR